MYDLIDRSGQFVEIEVINIYQQFLSLETEKRERIINAAFKEFTRNGYAKASTNAISREADISKGSLFNYFHSKKGLYVFLLDYVVKEVIEKIYREIDTTETDFFKRIREVGLIKFKIMKKYPQAFDFLKTVAQEDAVEVKQEIEEARERAVGSGLDQVYQNIDWTKFRDDVDLQKTMNIINWTFLSFSEQQISAISSYGDISLDLLREWDQYFDILKRCFYKEEENDVH